MDPEEIVRHSRIRFLEELRHHMAGWVAKAREDMSANAYAQELASLRGDLLYSNFGFAIPEYVLIRLMGRMSISIGRRLGEIYDKVQRFVVARRLGLSDEQATGEYGPNNLRLDIRVPMDPLNADDEEHVRTVTARHLPDLDLTGGLAIEVRYNFNPNDNARLRKDASFPPLLQAENLAPIYLVFSGISPRIEAIARLRRSGWTFLIGEGASNYMTELTGIDLQGILNEPAVRAEVDREVASFMTAIYDSPAFRAVGSHRLPPARP